MGSGGIPAMKTFTLTPREFEQLMSALADALSVYRSNGYIESERDARMLQINLRQQEKKQ